MNRPATRQRAVGRLLVLRVFGEHLALPGSIPLEPLDLIVTDAADALNLMHFVPTLRCFGSRQNLFQ